MFLAGDGPTGVLVLSGSSGRVEEDRCSGCWPGDRVPGSSPRPRSGRLVDSGA